MARTNNDCMFTMDAVDNTSSALMRLFTAYRTESNTCCGTSLLAAATRHTEYNNIGCGGLLAMNSSRVTIGRMGAISWK